MADLDELKNLKLKKTTTKVGRKGMEMICKNEDEQMELMNIMSFESYYPIIAPYSFKSLIVSLTEEEITQLISCGEKVAKERSWNGWKKEMSETCMKIEEAIYTKMKVKSGFVRFNTLSPKDAIFSDHEMLVNELSKALKVLEKDKGDYKSDLNKKIYALYIASTEAMKIRKGEDAVRLLIHSHRTTHELKKYKEGKLKKPVLIVREFNQFDVQYEFRAFVYEKKLVCLSQYNPLVYFPHVKTKKKEIGENIQKFVDTKLLKDKNFLKLKSFIIDIVLVGDEVKIVELNPYGEFAGSCLFDWSVASDFKILTGKSKFEFRIVEDVVPFVRRRLEKRWIKILDKV